MNDQQQEPVLTPESSPRPRGRSAVLALGIAAAIIGAPPMGRRIRSTGDADVDASLDRALANRDRLLADDTRLAAANAKRARKDAKRARDHAPRNDADRESPGSRVDRSRSSPNASARTPDGAA